MHFNICNIFNIFNVLKLCLFEQLHRVDQQQVREFSPAPPPPWARHCGALLHCFSGLVFHALGPIGENIQTWLRCRRMQTMCINIIYIYTVCVCVCLYIDRYDIARLHISYMYTHIMYVHICICRLFFNVTCAILRHSLHRFFKRMAEGRCTSPGYGSNFGIFLAGNQRTKPGRLARPQGFPRTACHGWLPNIYIYI